jgi:hypothetical protein
MTRKSSVTVAVVLVLVVAALVLGGGQWLWHVLLRMHGMAGH